MFKKLLSNLPFNPSLIGQVAFYGRRMHREESVRRVGLGFILIAMAIQVFAVVSPPEPTLAESSNDVLRGGFTTREQAVNYCRTNTQNFANVLAYYQVSCDALASAGTVTIKSTDEGRQLDSLGRNPQGATIARTGKPTEEYRVSINGKNYYMKNLWAWDSRASSSYKVLTVKNRHGVTIKIMFTCGNIITTGKYTPPPPPKPPKPPEQKDVCPKIPDKQYSKEECDVCPNIPNEQSDKSECYPCPEAQNEDSATVCLELSKNATNQTQRIEDANETLAQANDAIVYTLSVKNKGKTEVKDFVIEENLADVLEYANIVDLDGGTLDKSTQLVHWPKQHIPAGATIQKKITIKVKDPIPQTPVSVSDLGSHDLVMANVYGDSIHIKLPPGVVKSTEQIVQTLPNTGPGTTLAIGFTVTVLASYFFARSRLIRKEIDVVRMDYTATGGA